MKLKDILLTLFGIQVVFLFYYLPRQIEGISKLLEYGGWGNLGYFLSTFVYYAMVVIGAIGAIKYFENRNFFNPFLKAYFMYDLISFILNIPNTVYYFSNDQDLQWIFYFFQVRGLLMVVLVILIFSKEKVSVNITPGKKKRTRFYHAILDNIFLLVVTYQLIYNSPYSQMYPILPLVLPYLFFIIYYWIAESVFQQTIGKIITGKYVRKVDGSKAGAGKILGRTFSRLIPFEPFSFFTYPVKGWHDSISKTGVYSIAENQEEGDDIIDHLIDGNQET